MKGKYCLPIITSNTQDVLAIIKENMHEYAYFEIWLEYIENLTPGFVHELLEKYDDKLIFLFRRKNLEKEHMNDMLRNTIMETLQNTKALIDIDVEKQTDLLEVVTKRHMNKQIIASYHEYTHTPSDEVLNAVIEKMHIYTPAIYKISTFCKTEQDAIRLLRLLVTLKSDKKQCIILGMGKHGLVTRIFGTLWGNEMIFAPKALKEASAPGQLTKQQLESIFTIMEKEKE